MKLRFFTPLASLVLLFAAPQLLLPAHIIQHNLVSNSSGLADHTDANLVNPWGMVHSPSTPWWVSDNGTGVSTLYSGDGTARPLVVSMPAPGGGKGTPTGVLFNTTTGFSDFKLSGHPSLFLFVTEDGTILAWAPSVDMTNAHIVGDNSASGAVYKGAAIAQQGSDNRLYIANFHAGTVEVYDTNFKPVTLPAGAFTDPNVPSGFGPFNIMNIDGRLFVAFAQQKLPDRHDEADGPGLGYVDIFDTSGHLIQRLEHGKWMNAPWGMVQAPANFGKWSKRLLIGQFGSGQIASFDPESGEFEGLLRGEHGKPVTINGLWGLSFGNDAAAGPSTTLFFAAGINDEADGLFGTLVPSKSGDNESEQGDDHESSDE